MKKGLRYTLFIAVVAVFTAVMALICSFVQGKRFVTTCSSVDVRIKDRFEFVKKTDVEEYLNRYYGSYVGQRLDSVDLVRIESMLDRQSAVLKSEAWTTRDGVLHIEISQREPVVRFQKGGYGFYADDRGFIFPLQSNYTSLVPVVDGNLPLTVETGFKGEPATDGEKNWVSGILEMVRFMQHSRTWAESIVQMHVDSRGDLILIPREGKERFIFGYPSEIPAKFARMEEYYRYIKPSKPEGFYSSVNVKYNGQVICREK